MKIHEFQGKAILSRYGVPVPKGEAVSTPDEAQATAERLGGVVVVKAQIHAGGRGKGGGVKVVKSAAEAKATASKMLGMTLVTHQTGPEGRVVKRLLVEQGLDIKRELYLGLVIDAGANLQGLRRSGPGFTAISGAAPRVRARAFGRPGGQGGQADDGRLSGLRLDRRVARRDQPAHRHRDR
jgi:succinyl-CoA synthetase beta subunit